MSIPVFIGLNINLDALIFLRKSEDFARCQTLLKKIDEVTATCFTDCVSRGESHEALVPSTVTAGLCDNFENELVVAGQAGFFLSNVLRFPTVLPVLHLPNRSELLIQKLREMPGSERIRVFGKNGALVPLNDVEIDHSAAPPVHAVLEYGADLEALDNSGKPFKTTRNNRFIFTYDPTNSNLVLDKEFITAVEGGKAITKEWTILISGYHLLTKDVLTSDFKVQHKRLFELLHEQAGHIHFEIAYTNVFEVREFIIDSLLRHADSVGLNEVELKLFCKTILEEKTRATDALSNLVSALPASERDLLHEFHKIMNVPLTLFHTFGLYIAVVSDEVATKYTEDSFQRGFHIAEKVVCETRRLPESVEYYNKSIPYDYSIEGRKAHLVKLIKPITSSVGLGDTISSSIILGILNIIN